MEGMEIVADDEGPAHNDLAAKDDEEDPWDRKAVVMYDCEDLADKKMVGENEGAPEGTKVVVMGDEEDSTGKKTVVTDDWGDLVDRWRCVVGGSLQRLETMTVGIKVSFCPTIQKA